MSPNLERAGLRTISAGLSCLLGQDHGSSCVGVDYGLTIITCLSTQMFGSKASVLAGPTYDEELVPVNISSQV